MIFLVGDGSCRVLTPPLKGNSNDDETHSADRILNPILSFYLRGWMIIAHRL